MCSFDGWISASLAIPRNFRATASGYMQLTAALVMAKNLTIRRFSNFDTPTVRDPKQLEAALLALERVIGDRLYRTRIGKTFAFEEIEAAMAYEGTHGAKAILVA